MHTFDTPAPISLDLEVPIGDVRIIATDRTDTTVDVGPGNPQRPADVKQADDTTVTYDDGMLVVRAPKRFSLFSKGGAVKVTVSVPTGTKVRLSAQIATVHATGTLGECRMAVAMGDIRCARIGAARFDTGLGDVWADSLSGDAVVMTGSGAVRLVSVEGSAVVKNSNGATWLGFVGGDARVASANGDITVDEAGSSVVAKSACGDISIGDVTAGNLVLKTGTGAVTVGVRRGSAAWLDAASRVGTVINDLDPVDAPTPLAPRVEIHARALGRITVRRSETLAPPVPTTVE